MPYLFPDARVFLHVVFETFGDLASPKVFPVRPLRVEVFLNSYKEADTWSIDFDASLFPFSPDLIRAGAAEIYLFEKPDLGAENQLVGKGSDRSLWVASQGAGAEEGTPVQPTIIGLFDDASMSYSSDGRSVTLSGRDYTSLFLDKQFCDDRGRPLRIRTGKPLDKTLNDLILQVPGAVGAAAGDVEGQQVIKLRTVPENLEMPVVGVGEGRHHRKYITMPNVSNYWEAMLGLAVRYGFILFVRGMDVVLTRPHTYLAGKTGQRVVAWGKNLTHLSMSRKIGKERVPVIEVRSYDDRTRKVLKVRYPQRGQKAATGLGTDRAEIRQFVVHGVRDKTQLLNIARQAYNLLARGELEVEVETQDLRDVADQPVLTLQTGDSMGIQFDSFADPTLREMDENERYSRLVELGYTPEVAAVAATHYRDLEELRAPMRVREATLSWDYQDGLMASISLQNFVNVHLSEEDA